jgi:integrase/recombinase XerD
MYEQLSIFSQSPPQTPKQPVVEIKPTGELGLPTNLSAAIAAYIAALEGRARAGHLSTNSLNAMTNDLNVLDGVIGTSRPVGTLTHADLQRVASEMALTSKPSTVERRLHTLNGLLKWLFEKDALPVRLVAPVVKAEAVLPTALTGDQTNRLLALADAGDPRTAFLVRLLLAAGLKQREVMALQVTDLVLDADTPYVSVGQGRKQRRVGVPAELRRYRQAYLDRHVVVDRLFSVTSRSLNYELEDLGKALGFTVNFSVLRWTCALNDHRAGKDPERLRLKMGLSVIQWDETLNLLKRMSV